MSVKFVIYGYPKKQKPILHSKMKRRKTMKKLLSFLLVATMLLTTVLVVVPASAAVTEVDTAQEFMDALVAGGELKLAANITLDFTSDAVKNSGITDTTNPGKHILITKDTILDLNGYVLNLKLAGINGGVGFRMQTADVTFTIKDSNPTAVHKYTDVTSTKASTYGVTKGACLLEWDDTNGTIEIPGGAITGAHAIGNTGAVVKINNADNITLNIEGGNFIGNTTNNSGGGACFAGTDGAQTGVSINVSAGKFIGNMSAASSITNNTFSNKLIGVAVTTALSISGGLFNSDEGISEKVVSDYAANAVTRYGMSLVLVAKDNGDGTHTVEGTTAAHTPGDEATCNTPQTCTECAAVIVPATGNHTGGTATCTVKATCTVCNEQYGELAAHTPGAAATCTTAQICTVCEAEVAPAAHTPGAAATCTEAQKCTVCNEELAAAKGHKPGAVKCTEPQKCKVCDAELAAATGHTPGAAATCTTAQKCTECREELVPATGHTYDNDKDASCNTCGEERTVEPEATEPEATEPEGTEAPATEAPAEDKGCKSVIGTSAVAMVAVLALGAGVVLKKKED